MNTGSKRGVAKYDQTDRIITTLLHALPTVVKDHSKLPDNFMTVYRFAGHGDQALFSKLHGLVVQGLPREPIEWRR